MSLLLCIWFALKIFLGIALFIVSYAAFNFSFEYSFLEYSKPWKLIVFPLTIFLLVVMWTYIIFNVDIEKYVTPPIKLIPETVQVQTNNPAQLENK